MVEVTYTGKTPEGKPMTFEAVDIFDFGKELIRWFSSWFDVNELKAQL